MKPANKAIIEAILASFEQPDNLALQKFADTLSKHCLWIVCTE